MSINFQKSIKLETYINEWIEEVKKQYYLKVPILVENLSDDILNEIIFNFLDKLTMNIKVLEDKNRPYTYYKDEEEINNIVNFINGLELFYEEIIKTKDLSNVSNAVAFLTPTYNLTGKFLLFNPLIQFNDDEMKLLNKYLNRSNSNVPLKCYSDKYYLSDLHLIALEENEIQTYNDYITKNNVFEVKRICNDIKIDEENIISIIESNLECLFLLDTPLYEIVRILLYIGVMKSSNHKVKDENVNYSVKFEELPIINYYIG